MFGGSGLIALYGLGALIACAVLGVSRVLAPWLAALIVGVALLAVAGIAAGVLHAAGNVLASGLYGASLLSRRPRTSRALRLAGLAAVSVSGLLGGHISFRLAGRANRAEDVPHLVEPAGMT
jgi:hypothetical protein